MIFHTPTKKRDLHRKPLLKSNAADKSTLECCSKRGSLYYQFFCSQAFWHSGISTKKGNIFSKRSTFGYTYTSTDFCSYIPFLARSSRDERFAQDTFCVQNHRNDWGRRVSVLNSAISDDVMKVWETIPWNSKDYFLRFELNPKRRPYFSRGLASSTILG